MASARSASQVKRTSFFSIALFASSVFADQLFTAATVPDGLSSACVDALAADVSCGWGITSFTPGQYYPLSLLGDLCVESCASSLASYHEGVVSSCSSDVWPEEMQVDVPVAMISEMIRYNYNLTCMTDGDRFCNNVAAAYLSSIDPEMASDPEGLPAGGDFGSYVAADTCDGCFVKNLRFQAGSPYFDGPILQAESIYQAKTSSCGVINANLVTTTISLYSPTTTAPSPTPTCEGRTYEIESGDHCNTISSSQGIGTDWLLWDNNLLASCAQFPSQGSLCLVNTCDVITVLELDSCDSIAKEHDISVSQLMAWNPSIDAGCYNLNQTIGQQLCVSKPGETYISPEPTTLQPTTVTTAAPVPTDVAAETNTNCGKYYKAVVGDYCNLITMKFAISLNDFVFLNPAINENCTNLYAEESYCVQAVGDINTYSGRPGHITFSLTMTTGVQDSATTLPDVAWSSPTATTTQTPVATGTREDCYQYLLGDDYQKDMSGTALLSNCRLAAAVYDVTFEDLEVWNPSLGNVSNTDCAFKSGVRYCARWYDALKPYEPEEDPDPMDSGFPSRDGMAEDCTQIIDVDETGNPSCQLILADYGLTIAQFYAWNPSVGPDCGGMWAGYHYCVLTSESEEPATTTAAASSTTAPTASSKPTPPGPTHAGQPENCNVWHVVKSGDGCSTIESQYGLTHAEFLALNPAVSEDCLTNFWGEYAYCVGTGSLGGSGPVTSSLSAPASTPTAGPVAAPQPNQAGNAVSSCNKYAQAQSGDWCAAFVERHALVAADFYSWNTVLGSAGENCGGSFWAEYWYCVGVASS